MDAAWRMGWQDWCQAGERRHFRRGGYYGVGSGELDHLKVPVHEVHTQDVLYRSISCLSD